MHDPPGFLHRLWTLSPQKAARKIRGLWRRAGAPSPGKRVTEAFLRSPDYAEIMSRHLPWDGSFDLHEAQNQTASFRFRHNDRKNDLGIFRWRGIQQNLDVVLQAAADPDLQVLDLGGAACPLGFQSIVVDQLSTDAWGRPVRFHSLSEIEGRVDVIFSSHTLEHIPPLEETLRAIQDKLEAGGLFILHLPSFSCERWRAGVHTNAKYNDHHWTFGLEAEAPIEGLKNYCDIRALAARFFVVEKAEYCGDDSIFLLLRKGAE